MFTRRLRAFISLICFQFQVTRKRPLSDQTDFYSNFKLSKIAKTAPSLIASSQNYRDLQQNARERILDDRPGPDLGISPLSLLYPGFGHFLDIMDGHDNVPGLNNVDIAELQIAVDSLSAEMTRFFDSEALRVNEGLNHINKIFCAHRGTEIPQISASDIFSIRSYGHNIAMNGTSSIIVEFKNSLSGITALPQIELTGHAARLYTQDVWKEAFKQSRAPLLGLTIVGKLDNFVYQSYSMI